MHAAAVSLFRNQYTVYSININVMSVLLGKNNKAFERFHLKTYLVSNCVALGINGFFLDKNVLNNVK